MDDFGLDRLELTGSLINLEFGPGGRIHQLWVSDPNAPEESEEFQFVCPPVGMGEELAEDYFPGTILLGARISPDEPWILSRNTHAEQIGDDDDPSVITFNYDLGFLDDLEAIGRYHEIPGRLPQIAWDITIRNRSRRSIELGEVGFPLALNNVLEGAARIDEGDKELFLDRVHVHPFIGGAASYLFAQRLNGRPPGLAIFPGGLTQWEFFHHVPASLTSLYRWEGIPVVYAHSRATIEREEWPEWFNGHSATILEPGETREFGMRFAPADRYLYDNAHTALVSCGRPSMRLFPGAVSPFDVGAAVEIAGSTPTRFWTDVDVELETDADEDGGFCYVKPQQEGIVRIGFEDTTGKNSETHLLFTQPIETLIDRRANWIVENQVYGGSGSLNGAIVPCEFQSGAQLVDPVYYAGEFGIVSGLADALFLAEKNTIYPVASQIRLLDNYLSTFVEDDLRNPSDGVVGSLLPTVEGVAGGFGRPRVYMMLALLYESMARIAEGYGNTARRSLGYLAPAAQTALAMFRSTHAGRVGGPAIPLMSHLPRLIDRLSASGLSDEAHRLSAFLDKRWSSLSERAYPYIPESHWTGEGMEETLAAARSAGAAELEQRTKECAAAVRSLAPCWWWYGSDKRWPAADWTGPRLEDHGELCQGATSVAGSVGFFNLLDRDYTDLSDIEMRLAFGGMLGIWALVRSDGAAAMGFCPDTASKHFGMAATTGDIGVGLYQYLRAAGGYVLPGHVQGLSVFGCHLDVEEVDGVETYSIRPWDGVGRQVVVRQLGFEVCSDSCRLRSVVFDSRKRKAAISLQNPSDKDLVSDLRVRGLWGQRCKVADRSFEAVQGAFNISAPVSAGDTVRFDIEVIG